MDIRKSFEEICADHKLTRSAKTTQGKAISRDLLREHIGAANQVLGIQAIIGIFIKHGETARVLDDQGNVTQVFIPLDKDRIASLKHAMDGCFKLLAKTMPDVTLQELTALDGESLFGRESKEELEDNLRRLGIDPEQVKLSAALR